MSQLYEQIIARHNTVKLLPQINNTIRNFFNRPYPVIFAESIVETLRNAIDDNQAKSINIARYALDIKLDGVDLSDFESEADSGI